MNEFTDLRSLPQPIPQRIVGLRRHRGYPVPWFVADVDGVPDFRIVEQRKLVEARKYGRCWICGGPLGRQVAFVVGPMCAVNRVSSEPPSHVSCADWSARACPFLIKPQARRREAGKPDGIVEPPGLMLRRNPGVALVWLTVEASYRYIRETGLWNIGDPVECRWYREGRNATRDEVMNAFEQGFPALKELADAEGPHAQADLARMYDRAVGLVLV